MNVNVVVNVNDVNASGGANMSDEFLKRKNIKLDDYDFDLNTFEDLIDNFTPIDDIPVILNCTVAELDRFCKTCYNGMSFREVYDYLFKRANYYNSKAFNKLSKAGNASCVGVVAKYFMKLDDEDRNKALKIQICGNIPLPGEDNKDNNN